MTDGSASASAANQSPVRASVLALGLGNLLLTDDGVGLRMVATLAAESGWTGVEFADGGTQGIALLPLLEDRRTLLLLDAVGLGAAPGTVHVLQGNELPLSQARRSTTAHEGNAVELLLLASLLGQLPEQVIVVGVEPREVKTGIGLTPEVEAALPAALEQARILLRAVLSGLEAH